MKIGLVTIYQVPNFGSVLQAYATQTIIEKMGCHCEILNYRYPNELQGGDRFTLKKFIRKIISSFGITAQQRKIKKLNVFKKQFFHFTPKFNSYNSLTKEDWTSYDLFVVGSDQVWNTTFTKSEPAFLLEFLPETVRRISIASSFASSSLDQKYKETFKQELSKFSAISVRESNGLQILKDLNISNKKIDICLDPTLLLNKMEWLAISKPAKRPSSYILLYMWTYAFEPRPYIYEVVRHFRKKMSNCKVIVLEGYCNISSDVRKELDLVCAEDSTISEFIDLFSHSNLVITSSFHGTAFAINMGVPLVSIVPGNSSDDRQSNLLNSVRANNCIVNIGQSINSINPFYDNALIQRNLNSLRIGSLNLIQNMIKG